MNFLRNFFQQFFLRPLLPLPPFSSNPYFINFFLFLKSQLTIWKFKVKILIKINNLGNFYLFIFFFTVLLNENDIVRALYATTISWLLKRRENGVDRRVICVTKKKKKKKGSRRKDVRSGKAAWGRCSELLGGNS